MLPLPYFYTMPIRPLLIIGTRPEAIKMTPVVTRCRMAQSLSPIVCMTGQHRELVAPLVDYFDLRPDVELAVMDATASLATTAARLIEGLDHLIDKHRPDWIVAQGDTTSTFAASTAAFYRKVPFLHVEAGLRTNNLAAPWPEEFHRRSTSLATTVHCAPTVRAVKTLQAEGVPPESIHLTGNTIVDALQYVLEQLGPSDDDPAPEPTVLITGHRRENFGPGLESICRAILTLAKTFPDHLFLYAVHLNPVVRQTVKKLLDGQNDHHPNIRLIDPPIYPKFVRLMAQSTLILSDSGGIQEETPTLGKPLLILRETTERPEAVEASTAVLVGTDTDRIVTEASDLLRSAERRAEFKEKKNPFGDGHAAERIAKILVGQGLP